MWQPWNVQDHLFLRGRSRPQRGRRVRAAAPQRRTPPNIDSAAIVSQVTRFTGSKHALLGRSPWGACLRAVPARVQPTRTRPVSPTNRLLQIQSKATMRFARRFSAMGALLLLLAMGVACGRTAGRDLLQTETLEGE